MTLNIKLIDNYRLLSDSRNYIIAKEEGDRIFHESFHSSIEEAINSLIQRKIRDFDSTSINHLLQAIKSLQTSLSKALQPLKLEVKQLNTKEKEENAN
jgi:hypothetical protein